MSKPEPRSSTHDMGEQVSDRSQTSWPPVVPLPAPRSMTEKDVRERVKRAAERDPTRVTGTCG
jgi:hypothetical protein